jgi:hypothetical protein
MVMSDNADAPRVLASSDLVEACMTKAKYDSLRTVVLFLGAGDKIWAVLFIFGAGAGENPKPILEDLFKNSRNKTYKVFIAVTDSGWITKTVWEDVMEQFIARIKGLRVHELLQSFLISLTSPLMRFKSRFFASN